VTSERDSHLPICLLAGGLSTRLRPVTDTIPKPMVLVCGRPFLHLLMEHFASLGYRHFVLAVSYLWEQIRDYFGDGRRFGWHVDYSVEPQPLGTGGAVLLAQKLWSRRAIVANADSFLAEDWRSLVQAHLSSGAPATLALVHQDDCSRFGRVEVCDGRITGFTEKSADTGPGWINAGVYVLETDALADMPVSEAFSLERDVFPRLVGKMAAYLCKKSFADIGTPQSLAKFQHVLGGGRQST